MGKNRRVWNPGDRQMGRLRRAVRDQRGAVLAFLAIVIVAILGAAGLALDAGRGYLVKLRLSRAVDSAALLGARSLRAGQAASITQAVAAAASNGVRDGQNATSMSVGFGTNPEGEQTVSVAATRTLPTALMRVLGIDEIVVSSAATAAVPPVDLVLILDQSGSLASAGAWDDLQAAASDFVDQFDDTIDQVSLISFQLGAALRFPLNHSFTSTVQNQISLMQSAGDTNAGEGLRLAHEQITGPSARKRSGKAVVFFTDGRPTAVRGSFGGVDRTVAVYTTGSTIRGYFNQPDNLPIDVVANPPDGCSNVSSCFGLNENSIRAQARLSALDLADQIREDGIFVYTIGLGNPASSNPLLVPDIPYLQQIANEGGQVDPTQPKGRAYFAPSAADLQAVFDQVAQELLVRLAQ